MIIRVTRKELDIEKYNACIKNSIQSNIYGFSWYLDIVCDHWDVLVLNNYEAVMPIPWRKKYFMEYVYPPFWVLQLGIFSIEIEDENEFLIELLEDFKFVEIRTNSKNCFSMFDDFQQEKNLQILSLKEDYNTILLKYKKDRKRNLLRAKKYDLIERWNDNPEKLIELFKANVGKRVKKIKDKDYTILLKVMKICIEKKAGEILSIYDNNDKLVASGFFLKYNKRVTILVSSTDFKNRKNGANTFLIDRAIFKYRPNFDVFDFGGSSMKNIAKYFLSFGGKDEKYIQLKYNNLPKFLKWFKR
ncbi:hypothetical protein C7447_103181 [Tenacibaculum adriaticum]|uniref:Acetyltransferase (GNAT) family protein n=1 Tax=Tenacibaculum adriaticum TaxID=413713 RepID=A0A5S5DQ01_9FLAO|nr:hypothetical protein [Tenacibaculum adriaticum]TYP98013.1 hypothetical protein C7447_103181 [Tenacibaculum adriaticum]